MKFVGRVTEQSTRRDGIRVVVSNIQRHKQAEWREYSPNIALVVPYGYAKSFMLGRKVNILVLPA